LQYNTFRMNKWLSGISVIVLLMIVMSSIIQFHHHDDKGNIIFAVTILGCEHDHNNEHDIHCCDTDTYRHCKCDHNHCNNDCSGNKCTAHLGDYQAVKQTNISQASFPTILFTAIINELSSILSFSIDDSTNSYIQLITHLSEGVLNASSLRAPPTC